MEKAKLRVDDPADAIKSPYMCGRKAYNLAAGPRGVLKLLTEAEQRAEKRRLEKEALAAERRGLRGGREQETVDGECKIFENPKNKRRELHNTVTGALNEMDEYTTPNERNANTTPDMAMDTLSSSWPRWDSVDTLCPGTASSWGNKSS
ncbi:hypothetical protein QYF36_025954 [Acer negundo]|nr:hypothetical protein QYF36_025954 [Acer negundo]